MQSKKSVWLIALVLISLGCFSCISLGKVFKTSGNELIFEMRGEENADKRIIEQVVNTLNLRLNALRITGETTIDEKQQHRIKVRIYGSANLEKVKKVLLQKGDFRLQAVVSPRNPNPMQVFPDQAAASTAVKDSEEVLPFIGDERVKSAYLIVERTPIVSGSDVRDARALLSNTGSNEIIFSLKPAGAQKLKEWTGTHISSYLAIVLNGQVYSAPFIRSEISDNGVINGRFTREEAENLALVMMSGEMPVALELIGENNFGN